MKHWLALTFILGFLLPRFAPAQITHQGEMQGLKYHGMQKWFSPAGQKIAEVEYSAEGDLLSYRTWDANGLLIDDDKVSPNRQREVWPKDLELSFLDNGIGFLIIRGHAADDAPAARPGERVAVHYELLLQDYTLIEETYSRKKPFRFKYGEGEVIPGFEQAVSLLKVGEEGYFYVPSELGYGGEVVGSIPPFSGLWYRIKFVDLN